MPKLNENFDEEHPFYEMLYNYGPEYVFTEFMKNPNGEQNWGILINPAMYKKALAEFTKYIYQWMGIIMRNTAILMANTLIAGHTQDYPTEEFEDFLSSYFRGKRYYQLNEKDDELRFEITKDEIIKLCDGQNPFINEVTDKYGQTYLPWVTQTDANRYADKIDNEKANKEFADLIDDINHFNSKHYDTKIKLNKGKAYLEIDKFDFLDIIGLFDWMKMPDGSQGFSDYGIEPLVKIIGEYNENLEPEEVIVIINKALDIYHMRGDMASIFIQGGSKSLTKISEQLNRHKKKIYITETQAAKLFKLLTKH